MQIKYRLPCSRTWRHAANRHCVHNLKVRIMHDVTALISISHVSMDKASIRHADVAWTTPAMSRARWVNAAHPAVERYGKPRTTVNVECKHAVGGMVQYEWTGHSTRPEEPHGGCLRVAAVSHNEHRMLTGRVPLLPHSFPFVIISYSSSSQIHFQDGI